MFISLADKKVSEYYKSESWYDENYQVIELFLKKLSAKPYANKLSAVTSVGNLFLTTKLLFNDETKNDCVYINLRKDAGKNLIVMSYHSDGHRKADAQRQCSLEEAIEYIDLYAMRLILEKYGKL